MLLFKFDKARDDFKCQLKFHPHPLMVFKPSAFNGTADKNEPEIDFRLIVILEGPFLKTSRGRIKQNDFRFVIQQHRFETG